MSPSITTVTRRSPKPGPELEFVQRSLASGIAISGRGRTTWLQEPRMPTGFPDLVAVVIRSRPTPFSLARLTLTATAFQLLAHLYSVRLLTISAIARTLCRAERQVARLAAELQEAGLATINADRIRPRPLSQTFLARNIVAIEAKVSNWRRALDQAVANTWFASESYILIPDSRAVQTAASVASEFGIGVLVFNGVVVKKVVHAVYHGIPSSYGSWMIHDWALQQSWREDHVECKSHSSRLPGGTDITSNRR